MATMTTHHLPSKVGVLIGKETTHGTKASTIDKIIGRGVVFAESVAENYIEIYDPANGQALQEVVQGAKDVGGSLSFELIDWQWLGWMMGKVTTTKIYIGNEVGTFAVNDTITGQTSGFTATISARSGDILTLTNITGTPQQGETFDDGGSKSATLDAFIHDISLGDYPDSLTIVNIMDQISEAEEFLGMRISEASFASARGETLKVDLTLVGIDEQTSTTPPTRQASTKTPWVWSYGTITLNGDDYTNVCDNVAVKLMRNLAARGGHKRTAHEVVPKTFKAEVTLDMDLPSSAIRTLRRAGTKVTLTLGYVQTANKQQATLTFSNLQIISDARDTAKDAETVRVSAVGVTGAFTAEVYDDIYSY